MSQLELLLYPDEVNVNDLMSEVEVRDCWGHPQTACIRYLGTARRHNDGRWRCLADIDGMPCVVQVSLTQEGKAV